MERKAVPGIVLTLLLMSLLSVVFSLSRELASLPVHNVDTGYDYAAIQEAINAAETVNGHTILVDAGTYYEHIVVNKSVSLLGEHPETTIIDGNMTGNSIYITTNDVKLSRFTIRRGSPAIKIESSNNVITNNTITDNNEGIKLLNSSGNMIGYNRLSNDGGGFYLLYSGNNTIMNNTVTACSWAIILSVSNHNHISRNWITSNFDGLEMFYSNSNVINNNVITQNRGLHTISLHYSHTNNILNNVITEQYLGIRLRDSSFNTVVGNTISYSETRGISLMNSPDNFLYHNTFDNNLFHVFTGSSPNVWDNGFPSGGNYWSDYEDRYPNANQLDNSGIWDTPYVIDKNNQDNYPLMESWSPKPPTPTEIMEELIETIDAWDLHKGIENSLISKLKGTLRLLDKGNENGAIHKLMGFMNHVEAQRGKKLTYDQADYLITDAQRIISLIEG